MLIAFDVDGTLIDENSNPREEVIALLKALALNKKNQIVVWSGGGVQYAERIGHKLGLDNHVWSYWAKRAGTVDIAFDDQLVNLGKYNIKI